MTPEKINDLRAPASLELLYSSFNIRNSEAEKWLIIPECDINLSR